MTRSLALLPDPPEDSTLIREWLRSKRSSHTQRAYVRDIATFYAQVQKPLDQVTLTDLQDYADWLKLEHPTVSTQARMLASVKSLLTFAKNTGGSRFNVGMALQLPQGKDTLASRILSPAQVQRMLYVAETSGTMSCSYCSMALASAALSCAACNGRMSRKRVPAGKSPC